MKRIILVTLLMGLNLLIYGQSQKNGGYNTKKNVMSFIYSIDGKNTVANVNQALIYGKSDVLEDRFLINQELIEAKQKFNIATEFVSLVKFKSNVKLLGIYDLLNKFKIDNKYRKFKLMYEGNSIHDVNNILASEDFVTDIVVNIKNESLNIISKDHLFYVKYKEELKKDSIRYKNILKSTH